MSRRGASPAGHPARLATGRRPGLLDGMLFIAATAVGLALWRAFESSVRAAGPNFGVRWSWYQLMSAGYILGPWSLALLAASARQPRPGLRRLATRPAFVVGLALLLVLAIEAVAVGAAMAIRGPRASVLMNGPGELLPILIPWHVGNALAVSWAVQASRGRRRWRAGWLDRLGWAVGSCWIALALASSLFQLLI